MRYRIAILLTILIVASLLRLYKLTELPPGLYPDEATNGNNALEAIETGRFAVFYPENNGREGLFINLQAISLRVFGAEPWALRLVSAVFGILTVLGMYLLSTEIFTYAGIPKPRGDALALFASFLVATGFWHINFSRIGFRAISAPFFLVFGFWLLFKTFNNLRTMRYALYAAICGLLFGLGFHTYIAYRVLPVLLVFALWLEWRNSGIRDRKRLLSAVGLITIFSAIAAAPLVNYFVRHPADFFGRAGQVSIFEATPRETLLNIAKTLGMFSFVGDWNWRHNFAGAPLLWWPVGALFLAGLARILWEAAKFYPHRPLPLFLAAWFFVMLGANFLGPEGSPHALRALVALPAVFLIATLGGELAWIKIIPRFGAMSPRILTAFVLILAAQGAWQYFVRWGPRSEVRDAFSSNYVEEAKFLISLEPNTPKYVLANTPSDPVRALPASTQTIIFLTGGWNNAYRDSHNIRFVKEDEFDTLDMPSPATLVLMQSSPEWEKRVKERFPKAVVVQSGPFLAFSL